jgi:hypothetical protein
MAAVLYCEKLQCFEMGKIAKQLHERIHIAKPLHHRIGGNALRLEQLAKHRQAGSAARLFSAGLAVEGFPSGVCP